MIKGEKVVAYLFSTSEFCCSTNELESSQLFILPVKAANHFFYCLSRNYLPFSFTLEGNGSKLHAQCNSLIALACLLLFYIILLFQTLVCQKEFSFSSNLNLL